MRKLRRLLALLMAMAMLLGVAGVSEEMPGAVGQPVLEELAEAPEAEDAEAEAPEAVDAEAEALEVVAPEEALVEEGSEEAAEEAAPESGEAGPEELSEAEDMEVQPLNDPLDFDIQGGVLVEYLGSDSTVEIPPEVTTIGTSAFAHADQTRTVIIPDSVTKFEFGAFAYSQITSITVPGSVKEISEDCFRHCVSLTNVVLEEGVETIDTYGFWFCIALQHIKLPKSLRVIGDNAFSECISLEEFVMQEGLTDVGEFLFSCAQYGENGEAPKVKELNLPKSLQTMGNHAFYDLNNVERISMYDTLVSVEGDSLCPLPHYYTKTPIPVTLYVATKADDTYVEERFAKSWNRFGDYYKITKKLYSGSSGGAKPTKIILKDTSHVMGLGEQWQLEVKEIKPAAAAADAPVTFNTNRKSIANVNYNTGVITALQIGTATITVQTSNNKKATCKITVKKQPNDIRLVPESGTLAVGQTGQIHVALPEDVATTLSYRAIEGAENVLVVGNVLTAVKEGSATIRVSGFNGVSTDYHLTILPAPTELRLNAAAVTLGRGESFTLLPEVNAESQSTYSFTTDNSNIAAVDQNGVIKAAKKKSGTATITVTTYNYDRNNPDSRLTKECKVEVVAAPKKVIISQKKATLGVGATLKLTASVPEGTASKLTASSGKKGVATVEPGENPGEFIVKAVKKGSATITIKSFNGKKATCKVTVKAAPEKIELRPAEATLSVGQSAQINVKIGSKEAASYSYSVVSGESYVQVDANGLVSAIAGSDVDAVVRVTTHNGVQADYRVHVLPAPTQVVADEDRIELGVKEKYALGEHVKVDRGQTVFRYESSNPKIAKIDAKSGKITAVKTGSVKITIRTHLEQVSKEIEVTVKKAPGKLTLSDAFPIMKVGESLTVTVAFPEGTASRTLTATPKAAKIATAEPGPKAGTVIIHAVAPGTTTITIKSFNGKKASCQVKVEAAQ